MNEFSVSEAEVIDCVQNGERLERSGHQGSIHIGDVGEHKILVKAAGSKGVTSWMCRWLLRREYRVYRQLKGISGIPRCYGFIKGRYLVLEYVESQTMRYATIKDRERYFEDLFAIVASIHERGVAHGDLKRKDNILVADGRYPWVVDFGVSANRRRGFHPVNHFWHDFSRQHDLNACLKHKYHRKFEDISPEDAEYYRPMRIEHLARTIKRTWRSIYRAKNNSIKQPSRGNRELSDERAQR